ncbi:hypothetical protein K488DRAFT_82667 [Vararia minispora EC-137]|uniref:Uncharacterized protein n=1 Tax=Vararia minispora EC-137 TaxID=1314806 RepID=A0ACB8QVR8_9AGAM|nr:hypothetical protein K488DRAFT_82667 [Vararia minispora EC-137]
MSKISVSSNASVEERMTAALVTVSLRTLFYGAFVPLVLALTAFTKGDFSRSSVRSNHVHTHRTRRERGYGFLSLAVLVPAVYHYPFATANWLDDIDDAIGDLITIFYTSLPGTPDLGVDPNLTGGLQRFAGLPEVAVLAAWHAFVAINAWRMTSRQTWHGTLFSLRTNALLAIPFLPLLGSYLTTAVIVRCIICLAAGASPHRLHAHFTFLGLFQIGAIIIASPVLLPCMILLYRRLTEYPKTDGQCVGSIRFAMQATSALISLVGVNWVVRLLRPGDSFETTPGRMLAELAWTAIACNGLAWCTLIIATITITSHVDTGVEEHEGLAASNVLKGGQVPVVPSAGTEKLS